MEGTKIAREPREGFSRSVKMQFVLLGFSQDVGLRMFAFEGIAADRTRKTFRVGVDLELIPRYGIRMQELPLLCRKLLEQRGEIEPIHTLRFTEDEMRVYADTCASAREAAALKRKPYRKPPSNQNGAGWRVPPR
jgi:hypothetical protein